MQNAEVVGYKFEGDWTAKEINNLNLPSTNKTVAYKNVVMQDSIVAGMVFTKVSRVYTCEFTPLMNNVFNFIFWISNS